MRKLILFTFLGFGFQDLIAQEHLSNQQLQKLWHELKDPSLTRGQAIQQTIFDSSLLRSVELTMMDLKNKGIDTIAIYSVGYPGYISLDTCERKNFPVDLFIFWKAGDAYFIKRIFHKCASITDSLSSSQVFDYYIKHSNEIDRETIMPFIYNGKLDGNNDLSYSCKGVFDEPFYCYYFEIKGNYKLVEFSESYISDKENPFHMYNIHSKSYELFLLLRKEAIISK
jgi:hypothetical protein